MISADPLRARCLDTKILQWKTNGFIISTEQEILNEAEARKCQKTLNKPSRLQYIWLYTMQNKEAPEPKEPTSGLSTRILYNEHPPCTLPFTTLEKKLLNDLRLEIAHRGSRITLRAVVNPKSYVSVTTIAEDESQELESGKYTTMIIADLLQVLSLRGRFLL